MSKILFCSVLTIVSNLFPVHVFAHSQSHLHAHADTGYVSIVLIIGMLACVLMYQLHKNK